MVREHRIVARKNFVLSKLNTLTSRMVAGMMVINLILLPLMFGASIHLVEKSNQNQFIEHIRSTSPLYTQMIRPEDNETTVISILDDILLSGEVIFAEMENNDGKKITSSYGNTDIVFIEDFFFGQHNDNRYFISMPVLNRVGDKLGTLRIGYSEQITIEHTNIVYQRSIIIIIIYFVISTLFVVLTSVFLTRSIRLIGETSQAIAKGELEKPFSVKTNIGEIKQLTNNLEQMRTTLFNDRQTIKDSEARIHSIVDNMAEGVFTINEHGDIESFNQAAEKIFGYSANEVINQNISLLIDPATSPLPITSLPVTPINNTDEITGKNKDGRIISLEISINELRQDNRRILCGIVRDITERAAQKALLEYQATHDTLTKLPNRMLFMDRLQQMLRRSRRDKKTSALLMLDLNLFKQVNDNYGHDYGDKLLQAVAKQLCSATRDSDTVARFGGDEFVVLLPEQNTEGAIAVANNILNIIREPYFIKGQKLNIGTSIGIAIYPEHGKDDEALMRSADEAMYISKRENLGYQLGPTK